MQVTVILWKAPDSFSFFKKSSSSISERTIDRGRQQALHLGNPLCRTTWEMGPEMMPCSSSAPGPGPQHLLEQLPQHMRGLNTDLTPEGESISLGLGLLGFLGPLAEAGTAGDGLPLCLWEVGAAGGSVPPSEKAAGDQHPGQHQK